MDQKARMQELVKRLNETAHAYYVLGEPVISDMQWDAMYDELTNLEKETGTVLPDSPTHRVGGEPLKGFEQHRHTTRLWSMDKVQTIDALRGLDSQNGKIGRTWGSSLFCGVQV